MNDYLIGSIRTLLPGAVGAALTWLASLGLHVSADAQTSLTAAAVFVIGSLWYLIVHALERRWPWWGRLLGVPTPPVYQAVGAVADPVAPVDPDADVKA